MANRTSLYVIAAIFALLLSTAVAYAQTGHGTSSISLTPSSGSITAGQSASTAYTVNLASGGTWGTNLQVSNSQDLSARGVSVTISNPSGDPPYSGTATIATSGSTAAGNYTITFVATGDDPSTSPSNYTLTVAQASSTTVTANTASTTTLTVASTSTVPAYPNSTTIFVHSPVSPPLPVLPQVISILAVIVMIAVIVTALKFAR